MRDVAAAQNPRMALSQFTIRPGRAAFIALLALAILPPVSRAADLSVQPAVSSKRPYVGDPIVLELAVQQSTDKPPEVETKELEGLGFQAIGEPARSSSIQIINGVRSESHGFTFRYRLVPQQAGRLTIPTVVVRQGKDKATTEPIEIEVVGAEPQDWAVVELAASDSSPYPAQTITLSVHVFLRRLVHDGELLKPDPFSGEEPPVIRIPWLDGTELLKPARSLGTPPQFDNGSLWKRANENGPSFPINDLFVRERGLFLFERRVEQVAVRFDREEAERAGLDGQPHACYRYTLPLEFRAVRSGVVGPLTAQLRGTVYVGVRRGRRGLEPEDQKLLAVSPPLTIRVASLPNAGQPDSFSGGVGSFKVAASAQPTRVRVGDPVTVTLKVSGAGNLEEIGPPNLAAQPKWAADFKVHDDPSPGRIEGDAKLFTFSVRPKHAEVKELPVIRVAYFNPKSKRYEVALSERIPLEVSATEHLDPHQIVDASPTSNRPQELEELGGGIAANYTGPDVLDAQGPYRASPAVWVSVALTPPAVWLVTFVVYRRAVRRRRNPALLRAQAAYRRASDQLEVVAHAPTESRPEDVARALAGYVTDLLNLPNGELTPAEARHHVLSLGAGPELADEFAGMLEQCDRARFAGGRTEMEPAALLQAAQRLIGEVERNVVSNGRASRTPAAVATRIMIAVVFLTGFANAGIVIAEQPSSSGQQAAPLDRHAWLARANAAFERGARATDPAAARQAFAEAITAYQQLLADGVQNGKLCYNLANACFRTGDVGRAILHYRLAERLLPRDEQVAANLATARARVAERIEPTPTNRLLRQLLIAHYSLSVRERSATALACYAIAWLLLGTRIWLPRRWLTVTGLVCLAVSLSLACSVWLQVQDECDHPLGLLVANDVVVRTGDGETYEAQFNRPLGPGVEFRVLERRDQWLRIELRDGRSGWVRADQAITTIVSGTE